MKTEYYFLIFLGIILVFGIGLYFVLNDSNETIDERVIEKKVEIKEQPKQEQQTDYSASYNTTNTFFYSEIIKLLDSNFFSLLLALPAIVIIMITFWRIRWD